MWKFLTIHRPRASARWAAAPAALLGLIGATSVLGLRHHPEAVAVDTNPIDWDGHRWSEFSAAQKEAFLGGFLAGAAAAQAYEGLGDGTSFDAEALTERMDRLRGERRLVFRYAPSLYHARLHDYLFYVNNREHPLYRAIAEVNFEIGGARP